MKKLKVNRFISCIPPSCKEKNEFDMTKTMDEAIRKAKLCKIKRWNNEGKDLKLLCLEKEQEVILTTIITYQVQTTTIRRRVPEISMVDGIITQKKLKVGVVMCLIYTEISLTILTRKWLL